MNSGDVTSSLSETPMAQSMLDQQHLIMMNLSNNRPHLRKDLERMVARKLAPVDIPSPDKDHELVYQESVFKPKQRFRI